MRSSTCWEEKRRKEEEREVKEEEGRRKRGTRMKGNIRVVKGERKERKREKEGQIEKEDAEEGGKGGMREIIKWRSRNRKKIQKRLKKRRTREE